MKKNVLILIGIIAVITVFYILVSNSSNDVSDKNEESSQPIYENTISPNEDFVEKDEDKVFYTVKVYYQDSNTVKVVTSSNSAFAEEITYEVKSNNEVTENDIEVEWQTLMGDTNFTKENQIAVAVISISSNDEIISQRKVNFVGKAVDIIVDTINNN